MKKLVGGNPQDFLSLVFRDAVFGQLLPYELSAENKYADGLIEAILKGEKVLVHFEFQSSYDRRIGERLLEYSILASRQYSYLPVRSFVIYLRDCGNVPQSPLILESPDSEEIVRFHYGIIELHKIATAELIAMGLVGLLALLPLTKDGAHRLVIDDMINMLVKAKQTESLLIGYGLATKVMVDDLRWLKWRFSMLGDFLRDSPAYQEILEEGIEKGREEELQQQLQQQRSALFDITFDRFPELSRQAKEVAATIDDPAILLRLIVKMSTIPTAEEANRLLLSLAQ